MDEYIRWREWRSGRSLKWHAVSRNNKKNLKKREYLMDLFSVWLQVQSQDKCNLSTQHQAANVAYRLPAALSWVFFCFA